ncbi:MAG: hypothetical protein ACJ74Y_03020, partial [Bryobacteraceae bacterium]
GPPRAFLYNDGQLLRLNEFVDPELGLHFTDAIEQFAAVPGITMVELSRHTQRRGWPPANLTPLEQAGQTVGFWVVVWMQWAG